MSDTDYVRRIQNASVYDVAIESPLDFARNLSARLNNRIWLKREDLQPVFSFKLRGAYNKLAHMSDAELANGVICSSAGNHAQGVALAAQRRGAHAVIVMPVTTPAIKVDAVRALDAEVILHGDTYDDAYSHARGLEAQRGLVFIHPFDDPDVIAGQGTIGVEILQQATERIDAIFVPIGGGGLIAGVAAAVKQLQPGCRVFGVEPEGADTMHRSFAAGSPQAIDKVRTIADSLGAPHAREYSFALCRRFVDELVMIDDEAIRSAMRLLFDDLKLAVEPACAAATAALVGPLRERMRGKRIGVLACGSNIDRKTFSRLIESV